MSDTNFQQLVESTDGLTSEFKQQAVQMFNQAVEHRVEQLRQTIEQRYKTQLNEQRQQLITTLTDKSVQLLNRETDQIKQNYIVEIESLTEQIEQLQQQVQQQIDADELIEQLQQQNQRYQQRQQHFDQLVESSDQLAEQVAQYADYVADQYVNQHIDVIEDQVKVNLAESVLTTIKGLFESFGVVQDQTHRPLYEQIDQLTQERDDAYADLAHEIEANLELKQQIAKHQRQQVLDEAAKNLTDIQRARLKRLMKNDQSNIDRFTDRVHTLVESMDSRSRRREYRKSSFELSNNNIVSTQAPLLEQQHEQVKRTDPYVDSVVRALQRSLPKN